MDEIQQRILLPNKSQKNEAKWKNYASENFSTFLSFTVIWSSNLINNRYQIATMELRLSLIYFQSVCTAVS